MADACHSSAAPQLKGPPLAGRNAAVRDLSMETFVISLSGLLALAIVYIFSRQFGRRFDELARIHWLSFAGGVSLTYIFLRLMASLEEVRHRVAEYVRESFTLPNDLLIPRAQPGFSYTI
jgi:hypothetical protein